MTQKTTSLRILFLRRMLWVLLPCLLLGGVLSYFYAYKSILEGYDLNLLDDATDLVHQVQVQTGGHLFLDLPPAAHQMLAENNDDDVIYAVWDSQQILLSGENELHLAISKNEFVDRYSFKDIHIREKTYRVILLQASLGNQIFFVSVAQTTRGINHLLRNVLMVFLLFGGALIVVACIGVILGVKRSLVPIESLRSAIVNRDAHSFHPLTETDVPSELQPIIQGVNELLANLEKSVMTHRRFVADAAHQLRTPLAIFRSKLDVALSDQSKDTPKLLTELLVITERSSHLISQLLSLARIENSDVILPEFEDVDFPLLLRKVAADFVIPAEKQNMELEFELVDCTIKGNALLLQELIANLLDNAINYAGNYSTLKVRLQQYQAYIELIFADNGAGIPNDFLSKLGQPFFRVQPQNSEGCGLGLAIVNEIVLLHNGTIAFSHNDDGQGFTVAIKLPIKR
jgi:two-component system, OmpR family, sensor histidine kinase TctE